MKFKIYKIGTFSGSASAKISPFSFIIPKEAKKVEVLSFANTANQAAFLYISGSNRSEVVLSKTPIPFKESISHQAPDSPANFFQAIQKNQNQLKIEIFPEAEKLIKGQILQAAGLSSSDQVQVILKIYE